LSSPQLGLLFVPNLNMTGPETQAADQLHSTKYRGRNESFREAMNRQAAALTDDSEHYEEYREIISDMRFLAAGRVQSAAGSPKAVTAYNCFVSGTIEDSFVDGHGCIMDRAKEAAATMRMGGGIGYDFSTLRPRGATIKKLNSQSSGPVEFMKIFNEICRCIASSGHRRGAQMGVMRIDHPDIMEFIRAKQNHDQLTGFNISVGVTDEFMRCLENDQPFDLKWQGQVWDTVDPKALWEALMRSTWDWAEPGVLFIDTINSQNNLWYAETIVATNPCFTGDTKVWTAEHGHVRFDELVGQTVDVLTESEDGRPVYRTMSNIRRTSRNAKLVRVRLDNQTSVRCTPNHKFFLKDGTVKEARDLRSGDALKGVYRYKANQKGYMRLTNGQHDPLEHHVPFENVEGLGSLVHAHHRNHVRDDNRPSNLELVEASKHLSDHKRGDSNPLRTHPHRNPMVLDPDCTKGERNGRWRSDLDTEEMLEMRELGMSYAEIAKECGCSKYTVQKRIKDANHRVLSVEWLEEQEDVYCGTVDDPTHRFIVSTGDNDGVLVANCGEQPLPPYGACLLGSFNLTKYIIDYQGQYKADFNWDQFRKDIAPVVRAMDNVIDRTIYPLYEQEKEAKSKRRMGLGITGLANAGEVLGFPYGSKAFLEFEAEVLRTLRDEAYRASIQLAQEKGAFPLFDSSSYRTGKFIMELPLDIQQGIAEHGIRNSHLTSIAPTGTISLCADNVSSGIEPVFALEVDRTVQTFEGPEQHKLQDYGFRTWGVKGKTADKVTAEEHMAVLATAYQYVDSAVSKTCNVPVDMPWEDFKQLYINAWKAGCKGCTTFQLGGKRFAMMEAVEPEEEEDANSMCYIDLETGRHECE